MGVKLNIRMINLNEKEIIKQVVKIHLDTFEGFFLTFMGKGFLTQMYTCYCEHSDSGIYVAIDNNEVIGFLAFSSDMTGLYKNMIKKRLLQFTWYSTGAFLRKPKVFMRLIRAFLKPSESQRVEKYTELASIGVKPNFKSMGIGSALIKKLIDNVDFTENSYINLETDAIDNEEANKFYKKNGFILDHFFITHEGRKMNEYRYYSK